MVAELRMYGGRDPRELPAYSVGEAARYLRIPAATLRSWVAGRTYPRQHGVASFSPLIVPADAKGRRLSFANLVEAHVLRALRTDHDVPLRAVRPALSYAEHELGIPRLLLSEELQTHAGELFLERYGSLINLSRSGQIALKRVLEAYLRRVERDSSSIPIKLYPFLGDTSLDMPRTIVIDPRLSFGRPTIAGAGIRTATLAGRVDAGESIESLSADYEVPARVIEEALVFERAA